VPDASEHTQPTRTAKRVAPPEMPEIRMLLSLRTHESRTRRQLALCDELCGSLEALYRSARALATCGLGLGQDAVSRCVRQAPASVHTICSLLRDLAESLNRALELVAPGVETDADAGEDSLAALVREAFVKALDEHTGLRSWKDVHWVGVSLDPRRHLQFRWAAGMDCLRKAPQKGFPALRPVVLLAQRLADDAMALLDPATGPIAEVRANAYAGIKRVRAQIDHVRNVVNRKCDALEGEMRAVQRAVIRAQSQTMALVKSLTGMSHSAN